MTFKTATFTQGLALTLAFLSGVTAHAAPVGGIEGFRLPPSPQRAPEAQGPVEEGMPAPRARPAPAPEPILVPEVPTAPADSQVTAPPAAAPEAAPPPAGTRPSAPPAPSANRERGEAPPAGESAPAARPTVAAPAPGNETPARDAPPARTGAPSLPSFLPPPVAAPDTPGDDAGESTQIWTWILLGFVAALWLAGFFWLRARRTQLGPVVAPIQRPKPVDPDKAGSAPADEAHTTPTGDAEGPLQFRIKVERIGFTLINASLNYHLILANTGDEALHGIVVGADIVAAHASLQLSQQLAGPDERLEARHRIAVIEPGQQLELRGSVQLPIADILPIRHGEALLFIPLLRLRIDMASHGQPILRTLVAGRVPQQAGKGLQPLRLDLGPRIYGDVGQRPINAAPPPSTATARKVSVSA